MCVLYRFMAGRSCSSYACNISQQRLNVRTPEYTAALCVKLSDMISMHVPIVVVVVDVWRVYVRVYVCVLTAKRQSSSVWDTCVRSGSLTLTPFFSAAGAGGVSSVSTERRTKLVTLDENTNPQGFSADSKTTNPPLSSLNLRALFSPIERNPMTRNIEITNVSPEKKRCMGKTQATGLSAGL